VRTLPPRARELDFPERVALFVCALHKAQATTLLELFAETPRQAATNFAQELTNCDSGTRQARLSREFGARVDAMQRLRKLVVDAPLALRFAIVEQLPPAQRALFPHLQGKAAAPPAMRAIASRLIREAAR
jgi:hypothetical protein